MQTAAEKTSRLDVDAIQKALQEDGLDGWLFYYFHENDPLALRILGLTSAHFVSRRWFYFIPKSGEPIKLVHRIEMDALDQVPGKKLVYLGWKELQERLKEVLSGVKNVAMQYSPENAIPYISRIDAGTVELINSLGVQVTSSADLVQKFEATWKPAQLESHKKACDLLRKIISEAFAEIKRLILKSESVNEYQIQQFICQKFDAYGMTTNSPPIVAVNAHSGLPHYQPTAESHSSIQKDDFVLLDIWAKLKEPEDAVYADITWTGYVGTNVPEKYKKIFDIVRGGRDAAVDFVRANVLSGKTIHGWQVDDVCRNYIAEQGYGKFFVHRTGHSIGLEVHANGANIDNLETKDERKLIPFTCFSVEPGVYLDEFGVRSEIDVYIGEKEVIIAGLPVQTEVIPILS